MRSVWWSRRAITLHVALVVAVPLFLALGAWQFRRALTGNLLSWAYTFEWPFFAGYATWMWWRLVHEETATAADLLPATGRRRPGARSDEAETGGSGAGGGDVAIGTAGGGDTSEAIDERRRPAAGGSVPVPRSGYDPFDDEADAELAAYNRYLTGLHAERPER
jgi:hypothetical protein